MHKQGHVTPFWNEQHRELSYRREPFNSQDDVQRWKAQGYTQQYFAGELFDMSDIMPKWVDPFLTLFPGINVGLCFYKMTTCNIIPYHKDLYTRYRKIFNISNPLKIWRALIFLEDWKPGHIFEVDSHPITQWRSGDYVMWQYDTPHMAANLGLDDRYTLQITLTHE